MKKRFLSLFLVLSMVLGCVPAMAEAAGETTTITLYPANANLQSGVVGGYKADIFDDYGIAVDVWAYSPEKTNAILASGDLPDVMYVTADNLEVLIEGGMVLNLEDYLDKLPNLVNNENVATALNYVRQFRSAGTGELYAVPTRVGVRNLNYSNLKSMVVLNWKYYNGIGAPAIKDQWELIDVVKQMQDAYPTADDGIQNWGIYLNTGSDSTYWANMTMYYRWYGYDVSELYYLLEADLYNGKVSSILNDDSKYKEGLKWYNTAYRAGIMDPDSITLDRATQKAKVDGRYAMLPTGTLQGYGGYQPIWIDNEQVVQESWNSPYGGNELLVINAKSKNIEGALKFLNMLADPNAYFRVLYGNVPGAHYEINGNVLNATEAALTEYATVGNANAIKLATGEELTLWNTAWVIDDTMNTTYVDEEGNPRGIRMVDWPQILALTSNTEQMNQWREMSGYDFWVNQAQANNAFKLYSDLDYIANFTSLPDDMMKLTLDAMKDIVVNASWQMVYAETDEQFESIWDQMVFDCEALGAKDIIEWRLADIDNALVVRDSLSK